MFPICSKIILHSSRKRLQQAIRSSIMTSRWAPLQVSAHILQNLLLWWTLSATLRGCAIFLPKTGVGAACVRVQQSGGGANLTSHCCIARIRYLPKKAFCASGEPPKPCAMARIFAPAIGLPADRLMRRGAKAIIQSAILARLQFTRTRAGHQWPAGSLRKGA